MQVKSPPESFYGLQGEGTKRSSRSSEQRGREERAESGLQDRRTLGSPISTVTTVSAPPVELLAIILFADDVHFYRLLSMHVTGMLGECHSGYF